MKTNLEDNRAAVQNALVQARDELTHRSKAVLTFQRYAGEILMSTLVVRVFISWTPTEHLVEVGMRHRRNNPFSLFQNRVSAAEYVDAILERIDAILESPVE